MKNNSKKNIPIYLRELEDDVENAIDKGIKNSALAQSGTDIKTECLDFMERNRLLNNNSKSNVLRFVGSFDVEIPKYNITIMFKVFPKYVDMDMNMEKKDKDKPTESTLPQIIQVIDRTGHLYDYEYKPEFEIDKYEKQDKTISRYQLAKWLVEDYSTNGIFFIKEKKTTRQNKGRINWGKTIDRLTPFIDGDDVLYHNPYRKYISKNDSVLLSEIHRCAVKEACDFLKEETGSVIEPECDAYMLGKLEQYASVIRKYQRIVFADREIRLLRSLEAWCSNQSRYYKKPIGTVSFNLVWEDCLRDVFGNISKNFSFGGAEYRIGVDENGKERSQALKSDSIPDVINIFETNNQPSFLLLDAKYYLGKIEGNTISFVPGYKDIAKQIDYFNTMINRYNIAEKNGINAFVMPWHDMWHDDNFKLPESEKESAPKRPEWMRYLGYAHKGSLNTSDEIYKKLESFQKSGKESLQTGPKNERNDSKKTPERAEKVLVIQIEPNWLYKEMLNKTTSKAELVKEAWDYLNSFL